MTMHDLIRGVAQRLALTQLTVAEVVHMAFTQIQDALMEGERVTVGSFGTFRVNVRAARMARNPRTGAAIPIPDRKVVSFRPGKELKDRVARSSGQDS